MYKVYRCTPTRKQSSLAVKEKQPLGRWKQWKRRLTYSFPPSHHDIIQASLVLFSIWRRLRRRCGMSIGLRRQRGMIALLATKGWFISPRGACFSTITLVSPRSAAFSPLGLSPQRSMSCRPTRELVLGKKKSRLGLDANATIGADRCVCPKKKMPPILGRRCR